MQVTSIERTKSTRVRKAPFANMVWIPGGTFMMGSNDHYPEEAPAHPVTVDGFWMDQYTVTNAQFSRFVEETNYVTSAHGPTDRHLDLSPWFSLHRQSPLLATKRHKRHKIEKPDFVFYVPLCG